jgi:phospholipid/cholesterol/gamma-HCH transport system permease protein
MSGAACDASFLCRERDIPVSTDPSKSAVLTGPVTLATLGDVRQMVDGQERADLGGVTELDTAGAWLLATARPGGLTLDNASEPQRLLVSTVLASLEQATPPPGKPVRFGDGLARFGARMSAALTEAVHLLSFLGQVISGLVSALIRPGRLRWTSLVFHMAEAGLAALPIALLMGFLIGIVLAFQAAVQLQQFGAEIFVVDLVAISILRELGILLTAIIVAGRSASAFTASIGSMKMREEIDAMRVLGLDPISVLVIPRTLALILTLPLLGFAASLAGIFGGGLMAWINLDISPGMFRSRLLEGTDVRHALVGLSKAPFFALIIGVIGCFRGMQVEGNSESLGQNTSRSVVTAIFVVIVVDALFSIFFSIWGV